MQLARSNSESAPASPTVTIEVGGKLYKTFLSTLQRFGPNYFTKQLSAKYSTLFIDRNAAVFEHILDHMRGYPDVAESLDPIMRAKFEADLAFYELKPM